MRGSYSAMVILETGAAFQGCYYMLPQYRQALDLRQGTLLFHRSKEMVTGVCLALLLRWTTVWKNGVGKRFGVISLPQCV